MKIRMGIVDGHTLVREGLRAIVRLEDDMEVVFECDNFDTAKKYLEGSPDISILIVDISMHGQQGFELIVLAKKKNIRCIIANLKINGNHMLEAKRADARGYISHGASADELLKGIRAVYNNKSYCSKSLKKPFMESMKHNPFLELTTREMHICKFILDGVRIKTIAGLLDISPKTVYVHKANAFRKLSIGSTQDLFKLAKENGVFGHDSP